MTAMQFWSLPLAAALLLGFAPKAIWAGGQGAQPSSLMSRMRNFLGLQPRSVSVGGTRSNAMQVVCLLAPGPIEPGRDGPEVRLLEQQPVLVLGSALNEIELRRGEAVLWSRLASSTSPISGRLAWPLAPLQSGERLELAMRPRGAAGGDWAVVILKLASAEAQQRYTTALQASVGSTELRLKQLDLAITAGDAALAQALLWVPLTPNSSALEALQREQQANCQLTHSSR